jgi:hypothetical protein
VKKNNTKLAGIRLAVNAIDVTCVVANILLRRQLHSFDAQFRQKAVQLYVDGMNLRRIGRHLGVHHQSVANWVKAHAEQLPEAPMPEKVENAEMDALFTFIGDKKTGST